MYGLIGKFTAKTGKRDELIDILIDASADLPGNILYFVSKDDNDKNGIWITEVWESREVHQSSIQLPVVRDAIEKGKPLIASFDQRSEITPVGGRGL